MPISECPNCGGSRLVFDDREYGVQRLHPETDQPDPELAIPVLTVVCAECGLMRLFSTKIASLDALISG